MSIYVENRIRVDIDTLWAATQEPQRHERWDLRFDRIEYLPRPDASLPQRFLYATRVGFGLEIQGRGESVGERLADGERASALRFWSDDARSLIRSGSGYWKYVPTPDGVRFLTLYDYEVRFGGIGRVIDRLIFRPLLGWATAWSFDRLRLWLERGIDPAAALRQAAIHAVVRTAVAAVWIYQGLVPKLIARHATELRMLAAAGIPASSAPLAASAVGVAEVVFGAIVLVTAPRRWPLAVTGCAMLAALLWVALRAPQVLSEAFNPVALNLSVLALSVAGVVSARDLPLARRCLRKPPRTAP